MQHIILISVIYLSFGAAIFFLFLVVIKKGTEENAMRALGIETKSRAVKSPIIKFLRPFFSILVPLARFLQTDKLHRLRTKQFRLADMSEELTTEEFLAYQMFLVGLVFVLLLIFKPSGLLSFPVLFIPIVYFFPVRVLHDRIRIKSDKIVGELPHVVDMLALSTEAGLGFIAGLHRLVAQRKPTPLMMEFKTMLNEIQMGSTRQDALKNMMNRCEASELHQFALVLIQATKLGVPISRVLKVQSDKMRQDRFHKAERKGAIATQKLIFPLIFCIMPATMIVILGPLVITFLFK